LCWCTLSVALFLNLGLHAAAAQECSSPGDSARQPCPGLPGTLATGTGTSTESSVLDMSMNLQLGPHTPMQHAYKGLNACSEFRYPPTWATLND
jgi:hypothetical protein